jgi:COP9 signalosome complex subunit 6
LNESPLYLLLDADPDPTVREIPISIFESEVKIIKDEATLLFAKVNYRIDTGDAERLAVDHVARLTGAGSGPESALTSHLTSMHNAIKMLRMRVNIVKEFMLKQQKESGVVDHAILRRIASLCNMLPAIDSPEFRQEFLNEYSDALLVGYLTSIMKASNAINELVDKFNLAYDKHSQRRRGFY